MNCGRCGSPLNPGSDICPNCGVKNVLSNDVNSQITADMAPPTLDVNNENLTAGISDISNAQEVETYETPQAEEVNEDAEVKDENGVDIEIPSVTTPVENVDMPDDGSAPDVQVSSETVGDNLNGNANVQVRKVNILDKLGLTNVSNKTLIIVAVVALVLGLIFGKVFFSKNYCTTKRVSTTVTEKTRYVVDGKNNITTAGNFVYTVPTTYTYDKSNNGLLIYDENFKFRVFFQDLEGRYDYIASAKTSLKETLKEQGYYVNDIKEIKEDDIAFVTIEVNNKGENKLIAYSDAGDDRVFFIEVLTAENSYDYEVMKVVADIVKNATIKENENKLEKSGVFPISDLLVTASIEYNNLDKSINN